MKLYKVTCRGMTSNYIGVAHGAAYVVANNPEEAYSKLRSHLDKHNLGFRKDRELHTIELVAEDCTCPSCGTPLHL